MGKNMFGLSNAELEDRGTLAVNMGGAGIAIALFTGDVTVLIAGTVLGLIGITIAIIGQQRSMQHCPN